MFSSEDHREEARASVGHLRALSLAWNPASSTSLAAGTDTGAVLFYVLGEDEAGRTTLALAETVESRGGACVLSVAFSPDGALCAAGHADGTVSIVDAGSCALVATLQAHALPVRAVAFSADGASVVTGSDDCHVAVFAVAAHVGGAGDGAGAGAGAGAGTPASSLVLEGHLGFVTGVATAAGGDSAGDGSAGALVASSSADKSVRLWDARRSGPAACVATWDGFAVDRVNTVAFSPSGKLVASGSESGALALHAVPLDAQ